MDIKEKAQEYAQNKMQQVLNDAVAEAYMEGYKQGYEDCQAEIPQEVTTGDVEYVDLGLPSGTLWAKDYVKEDGEILYLPYKEAVKMSLPTKEQFDELYNICMWTSSKNDLNHLTMTCVGSNGNILSFNSSGKIEFTYIENIHVPYFWINDNISDDNSAPSIRFFLESP